MHVTGEIEAALFVGQRRSARKSGRETEDLEVLGQSAAVRDTPTCTIAGDGVATINFRGCGPAALEEEASLPEVDVVSAVSTPQNHQSWGSLIAA